MHGGAIRVKSRSRPGKRLYRGDPVRHRASCRRTGSVERRAPAATNVRAQAYIDEALGWLSEGGSAIPSSRRRRRPRKIVGHVAPVAAGGTSARSCSPTTTPTCATMSTGCLPSAIRVEAVADGQAALAAARRRRPDLVLTDVMMPRLDGFGLLRALRKRQRSPRYARDLSLGTRRRRGECGRFGGRRRRLSHQTVQRPRTACPRARQSRHGGLRREAVRVENELRRQAQMAQERVEGILASINDGFFALDQRLALHLRQRRRASA